MRVENGTQFGDLVQFVDFPFLQRVTRVVGSSLAALERSPRAPTNARIISANLSYDTELRNVTDYTVTSLNKDDNQVGVRAIDRDGNRSPVAYPIPAAS